MFHENPPSLLVRGDKEESLLHRPRDGCEQVPQSRSGRMEKIKREMNDGGNFHFSISSFDEKISGKSMVDILYDLGF